MKGLLWDFRCGKLGAALFPRGWSHGKKKKNNPDEGPKFMAGPWKPSF